MTRRTSRTARRVWIALAAVLAAGAAAWSLVTAWERRSEPAHGDFDPASRARLEELLRSEDPPVADPRERGRP